MIRVLMIQVATDNHVSNMHAKETKKATLPTLIWSSCTTNINDIILDDIENFIKYKSMTERVRSLIMFFTTEHYCIDASICKQLRFCDRASKDLLLPSLALGV